MEHPIRKSPTRRPAPTPDGPAAGRRVSGRATVRVAARSALAVGAAIAVVAFLPACARSGDPSPTRAVCRGNLEQLAKVFVASSEASTSAIRLPGPALFLEWRKSTRWLRVGDERVLICPDDPVARVPSTPEDRAAYDSVDLAGAPRALCSYAVRDLTTFPLPPGAGVREPIAACIHHPETLTVRGGVNVAYSDGTAQWLGYEELGVSSSADVTVGTASKAPLLRTLVFGDGSVK